MRWVAFSAAAAAAALYFLIGAGVLPIGTPADGSAGDLLGFGLTLGGTFAAIALLTLRARARRWWLAIAGIQVVVLVGYFAFASFREPQVEAWGLSIKALQAVLLLAAIGFVLRGETRAVDAPAITSLGSPGVGAGIGGGLGLVFGMLIGAEMPLGLLVGAALGAVLGAVVAALTSREGRQLGRSA
jgi:hypothetical protein